jgi:hypothetical protein
MRERQTLVSTITKLVAVNSTILWVGNPPSVGQDSEGVGPTVASVVPSPPARFFSSPKAALLTAGKLRILQTALDAYLLSGILS